jgi:hypothetical protein
MNRNTLPPSAPRIVHDIPGFKGLTVTVYGNAESTPEGYFVELDGQHTIRAELLDAEKQAIRAFICAHYPQLVTS